MHGRWVQWQTLLNAIALGGCPESAFYDGITDPLDRTLYVEFEGRSILRSRGCLRRPFPWVPIFHCWILLRCSRTLESPCTGCLRVRALTRLALCGAVSSTPQHRTDLEWHYEPSDLCEDSYDRAIGGVRVVANLSRGRRTSPQWSVYRPKTVLFGSQRDVGIHSGGATRGKIRRENGDDQDHDHEDGKRLAAERLGPEIGGNLGTPIRLGRGRRV